MFNPQSRWDRHLPGEWPRPDLIDEPVKVDAFFLGDRVLPRAFVWRKRQYQVKEVAYYWRNGRAQGLRHHFSVSDGANLFHLTFDGITLVWNLQQIQSL